MQIFIKEHQIIGNVLLCVIEIHLFHFYRFFQNCDEKFNKLYFELISDTGCSKIVTKGLINLYIENKSQMALDNIIYNKNNSTK